MSNPKPRNDSIHNSTPRSINNTIYNPTPNNAIHNSTPQPMNNVLNNSPPNRQSNYYPSFDHGLNSDSSATLSPKFNLHNPQRLPGPKQHNFDRNSDSNRNSNPNYNPYYNPSFNSNPKYDPNYNPSFDPGPNPNPHPANPNSNHDPKSTPNYDLNFNSTINPSINQNRHPTYNPNPNHSGFTPSFFDPDYKPHNNGNKKNNNQNVSNQHPHHNRLSNLSHYYNQNHNFNPSPHNKQSPPLPSHISSLPSTPQPATFMQNPDSFAFYENKDPNIPLQVIEQDNSLRENNQLRIDNTDDSLPLHKPRSLPLKPHNPLQAVKDEGTKQSSPIVFENEWNSTKIVNERQRKFSNPVADLTTESNLGLESRFSEKWSLSTPSASSQGFKEFDKFNKSEKFGEPQEPESQGSAPKESTFEAYTSKESQEPQEPPQFPGDAKFRPEFFPDSDHPELPLESRNLRSQPPLGPLESKLTNPSNLFIQSYLKKNKTLDLDNIDATSTNTQDSTPDNSSLFEGFKVLTHRNSSTASNSSIKSSTSSIKSEKTLLDTSDGFSELLDRVRRVKKRSISPHRPKKVEKLKPFPDARLTLLHKPTRTGQRSHHGFIAPLRPEDEPIFDPNTPTQTRTAVVRAPFYHLDSDSDEDDEDYDFDSDYDYNEDDEVDHLYNGDDEEYQRYLRRKRLRARARAIAFHEQREKEKDLNKLGSKSTAFVLNFSNFPTRTLVPAPNIKVENVSNLCHDLIMDFRHTIQIPIPPLPSNPPPSHFLDLLANRHDLLSLQSIKTSNRQQVKQIAGTVLSSLAFQQSDPEQFEEYIRDNIAIDDEHGKRIIQNMRLISIDPKYFFELNEIVFDIYDIETFDDDLAPWYLWFQGQEYIHDPKMGDLTNRLIIDIITKFDGVDEDHEPAAVPPPVINKHSFYHPILPLDNPFHLFFDDFLSGEHSRRLYSVQNLTILAVIIPPELRTYSYVEWIINITATGEDELTTLLLRQLPILFDLAGGESGLGPDGTRPFLNSIHHLAFCEEVIVRQEAIRALSLTFSKPSGRILRSILNMFVHLACQSNPFARHTACGMIPYLYHHLHPIYREEVRQFLFLLGQDQDPSIRIMVLKQIPELCQIISGQAWLTVRVFYDTYYSHPILHTFPPKPLYGDYYRHEECVKNGYTRQHLSNEVPFDTSNAPFLPPTFPQPSPIWTSFQLDQESTETLIIHGYNLIRFTLMPLLQLASIDERCSIREILPIVLSEFVQHVPIGDFTFAIGDVFFALADDTSWKIRLLMCQQTPHIIAGLLRRFEYQSYLHPILSTNFPLKASLSTKSFLYRVTPPDIDDFFQPLFAQAYKFFYDISPEVRSAAIITARDIFLLSYGVIRHDFLIRRPEVPCSTLEWTIFDSTCPEEQHMAALDAFHSLQVGFPQIRPLPASINFHRNILRIFYNLYDIATGLGSLSRMDLIETISIIGTMIHPDLLEHLLAPTIVFLLEDENPQVRVVAILALPRLIKAYRTDYIVETIWPFIEGILLEDSWRIRVAILASFTPIMLKLRYTHLTFVQTVIMKQLMYLLTDNCRVVRSRSVIELRTVVSIFGPDLVWQNLGWVSQKLSNPNRSCLHRITALQIGYYIGLGSGDSCTRNCAEYLAPILIKGLDDTVENVRSLAAMYTINLIRSYPQIWRYETVCEHFLPAFRGLISSEDRETQTQGRLGLQVIHDFLNKPGGIVV